MNHATLRRNTRVLPHQVGTADIGNAELKRVAMQFMENFKALNDRVTKAKARMERNDDVEEPDEPEPPAPPSPIIPPARTRKYIKVYVITVSFGAVTVINVANYRGDDMLVGLFGWDGGSAESEIRDETDYSVSAGPNPYKFSFPCDYDNIVTIGGKLEVAFNHLDGEELTAIGFYRIYNRKSIPHEKYRENKEIENGVLWSHLGDWHENEPNDYDKTLFLYYGSDKELPFVNTAALIYGPSSLVAWKIFAGALFPNENARSDEYKVTVANRSLNAVTFKVGNKSITVPAATSGDTVLHAPGVATTTVSGSSVIEISELSLLGSVDVYVTTQFSSHGCRRFPVQQEET